MSLYTGMPVYILVYNRPINEDDDGIPTHTHIYIDADLWCISIGMSRHTIGKQVFRFLQSSAVYLLSNLMWLSSFIISLCIYIYTCVWVCVCVCYTCHAPRYLGLCAQLQQAQQPERFLQCFFHADDSAVGPECRCLGPTVCHGNRKSCFEEGKFHGIPISQDLPIKKKTYLSLRVFRWYSHWQMARSGHPARHCWTVGQAGQAAPKFWRQNPLSKMHHNASMYIMGIWWVYNQYNQSSLVTTGWPGCWCHDSWLSQRVWRSEPNLCTEIREGKQMNEHLNAMDL